MIPLDRLGQPIRVGSCIAYGHALGRCASLRIGRVTAIKHEPDANYYDWKITVIGVDDDWKSRPPELCKRKGTLMFPDRMIVLDETKLPQIYRELLMVQP